MPQWNRLVSCNSFVRKISKFRCYRSFKQTWHLPSSASNCSLRWKVRIHDKPLVSSPGTNPTSFSRLISIFLVLNDLVKPSLGFWSPGMCSSKRRFFFTSIWMYFARSSMCRTRRNNLPLSLCWSRPSRRCAKPTGKSLLYTAGFPKWSAESHPTTCLTTPTPSRFPSSHTTPPLRYSKLGIPVS